MMDGHDEHRVNYQHLRAWLTNRNLQQLLTKFQKTQFAMLQKHAATIRWRQATTLADWKIRVADRLRFVRENKGTTYSGFLARLQAAILERRPD